MVNVPETGNNNNHIDWDGFQSTRGGRSPTVRK
jgi:hypothetical protein